MQEMDFIGEIQRRPLDDDPRLVFADWLDEQGDARGEWIRVQCQLWRLREEERGQLERREQEILSQNRESWQRPLEKLGASQIVFRRGFVHQFKMNATKFARHAPEIFRVAPLLYSLHAETPHDVDFDPDTADSEQIRHWRSFFNTPQLSRIGELSLRGAAPAGEVITTAASNRNLKRLRSLSLASCYLIDDEIAPLIQPNILRLRRLYLGDNQLTDLGAMLLVDSPLFSGLQLLDLRFNPITQETKEALQQLNRQKIRIDTD